MEIIQTDGIEPVVAGSAQAAFTREIAGVLVFGGAFGLAGVGSGEALEQFAAPIERVAHLGINTGIAVMNLREEEARLNLTLRDINGRQMASAALIIPASGHRALFVDQFAWTPEVSLTEFQGVLQVHSDGELAVTVLQTRPGQYATMPVVPIH